MAESVASWEMDVELGGQLSQKVGEVLVRSWRESHLRLKVASWQDQVRRRPVQVPMPVNREGAQGKMPLVEQRRVVKDAVVGRQSRPLVRVQDDWRVIAAEADRRVQVQTYREKRVCMPAEIWLQVSEDGADLEPVWHWLEQLGDWSVELGVRQSYDLVYPPKVGVLLLSEGLMGTKYYPCAPQTLETGGCRDLPVRRSYYDELLVDTADGGMIKQLVNQARQQVQLAVQWREQQVESVRNSVSWINTDREIRAAQAAIKQGVGLTEGVRYKPAMVWVKVAGRHVDAKDLKKILLY